MAKKNLRVPTKPSGRIAVKDGQERQLAQLFQTGVGHHRQGRIQEALQNYQQILGLKSDHFDALHMAGLSYKQLGMKELALTFYEAAISYNASDASLQSNYGNLLLSLKRFEEALFAYDRALSLREDFADAHFNKGVAYDALKFYEQAIHSFTQAIQLNKDCPEYFLSRGNTYQLQKRYELSVQDYQEALKLRNNDYLALLNLGIAYFKSRKIELSLKALEEAEMLQPKDPTLNYYKGNAHKELGQASEAVACYLHAIELNPREARYYLDLGNAQLDLRMMKEAIQSYQQALTLAPSFPFLLGHFVHMKCQMADWLGLDDDLKSLGEGILAGKEVTSPFPLLSLMDDPKLAQIASQIYYQDQCGGVDMSMTSSHERKSESIHELQPAYQNSLQKVNSRQNKKLRIGYYSSDFYQHATAYLIAQLFEQHDKTNFELIGFSFSGSKRDAMSERIELAFDQFHNVSELNDEGVANLSRKIGIDIAVDLKGYTQNSRSAIFAYRCAPVQVNYLGYPGTMSAPYMDFIVADKTVIPEHEAAHFSEHPVYLPHCYQVNDAKRAIASPHSTRLEHGLPEDAFVFCCFNNTYKIQPAMFNIWMQILKRVPNSVLWLIQDSVQAAQNLREHALGCQVDPSRLVFAKRLDLANHLERHRHANLFLDTFPYNAHTTASDALWSGLLVLTLMGRSFASRVGASLLRELKLNEFICKTGQEFEDQAVYLAKHQELLEKQRLRLSEAKVSSILFRGDLFARSLEEAYRQMYFQHEQGLGFGPIDLST
jgi:protein O-GlcNAc transferase